MDIYRIDPNFKINSDFTGGELHFYDVRKSPFALYGLYDPLNEAVFRRLPVSVAEETGSGVAELAVCTAGGRVRFSTDSRYIAIKTEMHAVLLMPHMAYSGSAGFDLYEDDPASGLSRFVDALHAQPEEREGFFAVTDLRESKMRSFTLNFPSYSGVKSVWIGIREGAVIEEGLPYANTAPVVYYGSSITQGGCASRPGNAYQNIISQRMNMDFLNLGFSGNGKGEDAIVNYMAGLEMSVFVSDYDHNAPTPEHLRATHCKMYQAIRRAHPDVPYIMLSRPDFRFAADAERRQIIRDTYDYAKAQGDANVYFIDGETFFKGPYRNICTVDGCHPTDMGFALMADSVERVLREALKKG